MSLEICSECNKKVSSEANSCPHCGFIKKKKSNVVLVMVICSILILGLLYIYNNYVNRIDDTRENRIALAQRLLDNECEFLTTASTEYIPQEHIASIASYIMAGKCDCLKERLSERLADKFDIEELQSLEDKPIHQVLEIKNAFREIKMMECFPLLNKIMNRKNKK